MHAVVRLYYGTGGRDLLAFISANKPQIETMMSGVSGFESYAISPAGGFTITVCADENASETVTELARKWIADNARHIKAEPPKVLGGPIAWTLARA